jgi:hypothetical protein
VDFLAPLSETVLRRQEDAEYEDETLVLADAIRPRIEFALGVPSITSHVLLVAGVSWRAVVPERNRAACADDVKYCYQYVTMWNADEPARAAGFDVAAKFVF